MFAFISTVIVIWLVMWVFFKFMYPKPPKHYFPKEGDVIEPRNCDYCGHSLEEYRGVLEKVSGQGDENSDKAVKELFFCNYEHQENFHKENGSKNVES